MTPRLSRFVSVTFLLIPALPPSQVSCDPALVTFQVGFCIFHVESTLKLYSGPTIQSRHHGASLTEGIVAI